MTPVPHVRALAVLLAVAAVPACVHYQPRPVMPAATLANLDARTLSDPGLASAVTPNALVPVWPPAVWDLPSLTVAAVYFQPDLEVARASWAVAQAGRLTAGERPNPSLAAGPGYNSSTAAHTVTPWILNLDMDFTIETAGKKRVRIEQAQHLSDSARFAIAAAAWQARARVRQSLLDAFSATELAVVLDRQRAIQERNVALLQRQLDAGEVSTLEMTQARVALAATQLATADARRQLEAARAQLAEAIGVPLAALDNVRLGFDAFRAMPGDLPVREVTLTALLNRADLLAALADYEASQSALQLEVARQYPDIHLGPGYQLDQGASKWTMLLPVSLPVFSKNRGPIAEADARRTAAAAQVTAVQARALGAVDRAMAAYQGAKDKVSTVDQLLVEARALETVVQRQLAAGEASQLDLGLVQADLAGRELARLEALVQLQQAAGELEDAMQRPLDLPLAFLPGKVQ